MIPELSSFIFTLLAIIIRSLQRLSYTARRDLNVAFDFLTSHGARRPWQD